MAKNKISERLAACGYEDVVVFSHYEDAIIGVTSDNRAVYDFDQMVNWLCITYGFTEEDAVEWIEYNAVRALPYAGENAPIVMYRLLDEKED